MAESWHDDFTSWAATEKNVMLLQWFGLIIGTHGEAVLFANQVVEWAISWLKNILSWWASEFREGFGSGWVPYIGSRASLSAAAASSSGIASCPRALILASSKQSHGARKCKLFVHLSRHMMAWQVVVGSHPCGCMLELNQLGKLQDVNLETNCNDSKWSRLVKVYHEFATVTFFCVPCSWGNRWKSAVFLSACKEYLACALYKVLARQLWEDGNGSGTTGEDTFALAAKVQYLTQSSDILLLQDLSLLSMGWAAVIAPSVYVDVATDAPLEAAVHEHWERVELLCKLW